MAQRGVNGGFIEYVRHRSGTTEDVARMSYVKAYPPWNWVFVTSIDMDEMEETIQRESSRHLKIVYREVAVFLFLFLLTITVVGIVTYFHSLKIKHGISLFTDFSRMRPTAKSSSTRTMSSMRNLPPSASSPTGWLTRRSKRNT